MCLKNYVPTKTLILIDLQLPSEICPVTPKQCSTPYLQKIRGHIILSIATHSSMDLFPLWKLYGSENKRKI